MNCNIRPMTEADLPAAAVLAKSVDPFAWNVEQFRGCLQKLHYLNWVLELDGQLIGFLIAMIVGEEYELINIAIAENYQHQGYGKYCVAELFKKCRAENVRVIWLEVRHSNIPAIQFYKKIGFIQSGKRSAYYPTEQGREDALLMHYAFSYNTI